ncbi:Transcription factor bHLH130-like protein [Drosera capensis]
MSAFNGSHINQHGQESGNLMPSCSNQPASFYVPGAEAVLMKLNGMHSDEANRVVIKHEVLDESVDQNHSPTSVFGANGSGTSSFSASRSYQLPDSVHQQKRARTLEYELMKQSGSHAGGLLDNIVFDDGIPIIRDVGSFRAASGTDRNPPMIAFNNEVTPSFAGLKGMRTDEGNAFSLSNKFQYQVTFAAVLGTLYIIAYAAAKADILLLSNFEQNENFSYPVHGLVHHLSLPRGSTQMAATMGTVPLLQHSVPVRIRAKRGCATHPRSIAERMRRMRISERIRRLQELFPNMDKANIADMLDVAAEYIKELQNQIKHKGHATVDPRYRQASDKHTQALLSKSFDGAAACDAWRDGAVWRDRCPARYDLNQSREECAATAMRRPLHSHAPNDKHYRYEL